MKLTEEQAEDALDRVESTIGMAHGAWDMVDRISIFRAIEAEVLRLNGITGDGRGEAQTFYLDSEEAGLLRWLIGDDEEASEIAMGLGELKDDDGSVQYGLRAWLTDYPEEGAVMLVEVDRPSTPPQQQQAAPGAVPDGWQPIETAPKDGTEILVMRAGDDQAFVASWKEYPGNPVVAESGEDSWMYGWIFKNPYLHAGGHEEGFLGWDDDPMPTHWTAAPKPQEPGA